MRAAAVVPAGGTGRRMAGRGNAGRKQYFELAGEAIVLRALRPFLDHPWIEDIIVVLPADDLRNPPVRFPAGVVLVEGGAERGDSVRNGLDAVPEAAELVAIHDGARPLLSRVVLDRALEAAARGVGAVAAVPLADTLKRVGPDRRIAATVDRQGLWRAQTPQVFPRAMVVDAYRRAAESGYVGTDDAAVVEHFGGPVVVTEGDPRNLKVTRPDDLALAARLLPSVGGP